MSDWLEEGAKAPAFTLQADDGTKVKLADLKGSPVVLYFYPADDTPGCTKEACAFRDRSAELKKLGAKVLGVSPDDVASHVKFRDKFQLNFPLLADPDHAVAEKFGALARKEHVRQGLDGHRPLDLPDRPGWRDRQGLEGGQGRWPRRSGDRGAEGVGGEEVVAVSQITASRSTSTAQSRTKPAPARLPGLSGMSVPRRG